MGLKVRVDQDTCTACELCYDRIPEVFKNIGDGIADVVKYDIEDDEGHWMIVPEGLEDEVQEVETMWDC
ncbi:MAG TPA: ferredoxin [Pyrodictiaceae archaeon]|nr:ferredoxin [Pyrodictiaceae archaeon]